SQAGCDTRSPARFTARTCEGEGAEHPTRSNGAHQAGVDGLAIYSGSRRRAEGRVSLRGRASTGCEGDRIAIAKHSARRAFKSLSFYFYRPAPSPPCASARLRPAPASTLEIFPLSEPEHRKHVSFLACES